MKWFRLLGILAMVAFSPFATANDKEELQQLLHDFLANTVNDDLTNHDRFWAPDLIYTSSSGTRFDKSKIINEIRADAGKPDDAETTPTYSALETDIRLYGTTAIVAFKLVATWKEDQAAKRQHYFNTGTFLKRDGRWQVIAWQATKIPDSPSSP